MIFAELLCDNDSNEEFIGFQSDSDEEGDNSDKNYEFEIGKWEESDRNPCELRFRATLSLIDDRLPSDSPPDDYFNLFINHANFEEMADETNYYVVNFFPNQELKPKSRFHPWRETTWQEIGCVRRLVDRNGPRSAA